MTGGRALWLVGTAFKQNTQNTQNEQNRQKSGAAGVCAGWVRGVFSIFLKCFIEKFSEIVFGVAVWCSG